MGEHEIKIGVAENNKLIQTDTKWEQRKGQDTDTYWYDEIDVTGNLVAKYIVKDSTSMYPPFGQTVSYEKVG